MTTAEQFRLWYNQWAEANKRENDWFPIPSTYEAFIAGFEAAQKNTQAPNQQNFETK